MKIWVKFNAGFQLFLPDFNFAPRSREAGDAPVAAHEVLPKDPHLGRGPQFAGH